MASAKRKLEMIEGDDGVQEVVSDQGGPVAVALLT